MTTDALIADIHAQTAFFATTYHELRKTDQLDQFDAAAGIFGQAYATREQYMEFVENFKEIIRRAQNQALDLKTVRRDGLLADLGYLHLVQSKAQRHLALLANAMTMYIWVRRAGKAWRTREHMKAREELRYVA